jgi:hypothetical protein
MSKKISELKAAIAKHTEHLKANDGNTLLMGENGPPSMALIRAILEILEEQEERLAYLETKE